jgi:hypothetical protein
MPICVLEPLAVYEVALLPSTTPIMKSLAFEVVIPRVNGEVPTEATVGAPGSNGVTVFAPEIPKANKLAAPAASSALTVMMSLESGLAVIAYQVNKYAPAICSLARGVHVNEALSVAVGGLVVGAVAEPNARYITSCVLVVVRVTVQVLVQRPG